MDMDFVYRDGVMKPGKLEFEPEDAGYSCVDTFGNDNTQSCDVWRNGNRFVVFLDVDTFTSESVQIEGLPDYLAFVRDYLLPLVQLQHYSVAEQG